MERKIINRIVELTFEGKTQSQITKILEEENKYSKTFTQSYISRILKREKKKNIELKTFLENKEVKKMTKKQETIEKQKEMIKKLEKYKDAAYSHQVTTGLFNEGYTIAEIVKIRNIKILTVQEHFLIAHTHGEFDLSSFINEEHKEKILQAIKKVGHEKLKPIKEELPNEIDYMEIKAVLYKYGFVK